MQGTVKLLNGDDGIAGVQTEDGQYTIIGLMDDDGVAVGDTLSGELDGDGAVTLKNETQGSNVEAYVEASGVSEQFAREQVG